jgi:hypothetical protein
LDEETSLFYLCIEKISRSLRDALLPPHKRSYCFCFPCLVISEFVSCLSVPQAFSLHASPHSLSHSSYPTSLLTSIYQDGDGAHTSDNQIDMLGSRFPRLFQLWHSFGLEEMTSTCVHVSLNSGIQAKIAYLMVLGARICRQRYDISVTSIFEKCS